MIEIHPHTVITRVEGLLATDVDGETVLMHLEQGQYYGLARTAQLIWRLLEAPRTFEDLCGELAARYAGAPDLIMADTRRFVVRMAQEKLVALSS